MSVSKSKFMLQYSYITIEIIKNSMIFIWILPRVNENKKILCTLYIVYGSVNVLILVIRDF